MDTSSIAEPGQFGWSRFEGPALVPATAPA